MRGTVVPLLYAFAVRAATPSLTSNMSATHTEPGRPPLLCSAVRLFQQHHSLWQRARAAVASGPAPGFSHIPTAAHLSAAIEICAKVWLGRRPLSLVFHGLYNVETGTKEQCDRDVSPVRPTPPPACTPSDW